MTKTFWTFSKLKFWSFSRPTLSQYWVKSHFLNLENKSFNLTPRFAGLIALLRRNQLFKIWPRFYIPYCTCLKVRGGVVGWVGGTWHSDTAFYMYYYVGLHLNFSSLVPLVTRTRSVSNSLKVTPLLPPTKLNTCSVMVMGTHSPKTAAVKTFLLSVLLAEEQSLNASWSLLFSESDTNKKCLIVLGCTNR